VIRTMTLAELRWWMDVHSYDAKTLAAALGVSASTVRRWLAGTLPLTWVHVLAISEVGHSTTVSRTMATSLSVWMTARGYSGKTLAKELDVNPTAITRWRSGQRPIQRTVVLALRALDREAGR